MTDGGLPPNPVHVLLFDPGSDQEGIHSLELGGRTVVLLFENPDDAERYAGLLEAQDFPVPCVEALNRQDLEDFCAEAGYEARFVPTGFMPESEEERLLLAPPERNMEVTGWKEDPAAPDVEDPDGPAGDTELEAFRRRLEGLL
ncbi:DUF3110 domain-containing protein [Cyanobium gracile UHCC 0139]|uniref:DUF3110 domain-containing protein n=1 Tax=Cyanobium gracile UHCC 0139 TaxID=3110308 RepID=A0ABU5RSA1_9CYAN|nr:DUF3110 domain-containing protein [Cyanobium gracile]MEA5390621.1 DUF3110 domain-containing protein [Cyanobium gracile UHCC 0139]